MSNDEKAARRLAFLLELRELTRKHGISIGGCGCCGSPFLDEAADVSDDRAGYVEKNGDDLRWVAPSDKQGWKDHADRIVRPGA